MRQFLIQFNGLRFVFLELELPTVGPHTLSNRYGKESCFVFEVLINTMGLFVVSWSLILFHWLKCMQCLYIYIYIYFSICGARLGIVIEIEEQPISVHGGPNSF